MKTFFWKSENYAESKDPFQVLELVFAQVELEGKTDVPGSPLRAPTSECGLDTACKDTCFGTLKLQIWERRFDGSKGKVTVFFSLMCFNCFHYSFLSVGLHFHIVYNSNPTAIVEKLSKLQNNILFLRHCKEELIYTLKKKTLEWQNELDSVVLACALFLEVRVQFPILHLLY